MEARILNSVVNDLVKKGAPRRSSCVRHVQKPGTGSRGREPLELWSGRVRSGRNRFVTERLRIGGRGWRSRSGVGRATGGSVSTGAGGSGCRKKRGRDPRPRVAISCNGPQHRWKGAFASFNGQRGIAGGVSRSATIKKSCFFLRDARSPPSPSKKPTTEDFSAPAGGVSEERAFVEIGEFLPPRLKNLLSGRRARRSGGYDVSGSAGMSSSLPGPSVSDR